MKILITGSAGMLGVDMVAELKSEYEVIGVDVKHNCEGCNVAEENVVEHLFSQVKPDWVVHCAAFTDVDRCETNVNECMAVNYKGSENIAVACDKQKIPLIAISTDFVFNGNSDRPYTENDEPCPIGAYGLSKLKGEEAIQKQCAKHYILRTAWLYGLSGNSFPRTILAAAKAGKPLRVVTDQVGSPTYTKDLACLTSEIIKKQPPFGIYNAVNSGCATKYELARTACEYAGYDVIIEKAITADFPTPARRPAFSVLDGAKLANQGIIARHWTAALLEFVNELLPTL